MKHTPLIILILCGLLVVPGVAYTQEASFKIDTGVTGTQSISGQGTTDGWITVNWTTFHDVGKITWNWDDVVLKTSPSALASGSVSDDVKNSSGTHIGNYTMTWDCDPEVWETPTYCEAEIVFTDLHADLMPSTGYGYVVLEGSNAATVHHLYVHPCTAPTDIKAIAGYTQWWTGFSANSASQVLNGNYVIYSGTDIPPVIAPEASFNCVPTSALPGEDVICTDISTNTPTDWLWMEGIYGLPEAGWNTATTQNYTFTETYPAFYTVKLRANNSAGTSWHNITDYVQFSINATPNNCNLPVATGYIRSMAQCVDSQTASSIHGCAINLNDKEGNVWSNNSATVSGTWCIDTLPGHHIDAYGSATGYTSTSRSNLLASSTVMYELLMVPGYVPNATAGKVWLYVLVNDLNTGAQLSGATVTLSGSGQSTQTGITDTSGQISRQWANLSTVYVTASKPGYNTGSKTVNTTAAGPDTVRIELSQGVITVAPTQTPGPGGTVAPTIGPYGTPGAMGTYAPGYTNNQGQKMMDYLATHGLDLVQLCFLVTVCALLGIKFGK